MGDGRWMMDDVRRMMLTLMLMMTMMTMAAMMLTMMEDERPQGPRFGLGRGREASLAAVVPRALKIHGTWGEEEGADFEPQCDKSDSGAHRSDKC